MDKLTELLISNVIGLIVGLGTSFFSWWVLFHWIVPRIEFSSQISKRVGKMRDGHEYRIKMKNTGRRAIIDLQCVARLTIDWEGNNNWQALYIPMNPAGDRKTELPYIGKGGNRVLFFYPEEANQLATGKRYSEEFRKRAAAKEITLEDVLGLGKKDATLRVYVAGYDAFSGARKIFQSKEFTLKDIVDGRFDQLQVIADIQAQDNHLPPNDA